MTVAAAIATTLALFSLGLVIASLRRKRLFASTELATSVFETWLSRFLEQGLQAWSVASVAWHLADILRGSLGMTSVVLLEPDERGWNARSPDGPAPPPKQQNVFAWFRHNLELVPVNELGKPRFGGMRLALEELCRQYGADALFPLGHRGQLFAVVACGGLGRPLTETERAFLGQLHLQASALAANARLYKEAALKLALQHEVLAARAVQDALVPSSRVERFPGLSLACHYRSASQGSRSIFTALPHNGKVTVVLGDVADRGVAGSLIGAVAKGCCEAAPDAPPEELLKLINGAIYREGRKRPAMRCIALSVEPTQRTVRLVNAGAPFPFLVRQGDGENKTQSLTARGPLLGDQPDFTPQLVTASLMPGDVLVLFGTGAFSSGTSSGAAYREKHLWQILRRASLQSADGLLQAIEADMNKAFGEREPTDDVLVAVLRLEEK